MSILTRKIDRKSRLTLPSDFAGCLVTVERVGDELRVRKAQKVVARRYTFTQLMAGVTPQNIHPEVETHPIAGNEQDN
jgi:antitoxin component of MazEF toxin-antitoxin module